MGLDLTIYELTTYSEDIDVKEHKITEVAYFSNATAMLLEGWLCRNHTAGIVGKSWRYSHYIQIFEDDIHDIVVNLSEVLNQEDAVKRDLLALHHFPVRYNVANWINSTEMFSEDYYGRLQYLYDSLKNLITYAAQKEEGKCFFYNICE